MHRFLSSNANLKAKTLDITTPSEIHHLSVVLRLKKGDPVSIFNGGGEEAMGIIEQINTQKIQITITSPVKKSQVNPISLTLACAIPKKTKFETIIEKCTELGVDRIIPMITERTEIRLNEERQEKKRKRYETVAINAAKQCQRNFLPVIDSLTTFNTILKHLSPNDAAFIPCLQGERKNFLDAFQLKPNQNKVIVLIGPEGDFTTEELKASLTSGCIPITLGPTTLKVDTAAISSIAVAKLLLDRSLRKN